MINHFQLLLTFAFNNNVLCLYAQDEDADAVPRLYTPVTKVGLLQVEPKPRLNPTLKALGSNS